MTYTFWHSGILIGESNLEEASDHPRQRGGVFRPTAYGLEVFPRLSGILSAGHALKTHLEQNGLSPEEMDQSEIDDLLDNTPAGQSIIDIGRMISDVEMRAPSGQRLEFASIGFSDLAEMQRLIRTLDIGGDHDLTDPAELLADSPRYIVSATLRDDTPGWGSEGRADASPHQRRPYEN
jgi:hypothetical protein